MARHSRNGYFKAIKRAKATYWSSFLARTTPQNIWTAKKFVSPRKTPWFPFLPEADSPATINQALLDHFFPSRPAPRKRGRLAPHPSHEPLTKEEIAQALSKSSPFSAPGPDEIPYLVWKKVNHYNPEILFALLAPLVEVEYHPPSLKHPNGVVLDEPGKPSYDSLSSFRIIVLLKTVSKILERLLTVRLMSFARNAGLLHPNQCGSLPGLSATDAVATLAHEVRTLQCPLWKVSTLFLDIKAGFDNVDAVRLRTMPFHHKAPSYMVDWVSCFLSERSCTLVFHESPNTLATVLVGTPQGSPIFPLLFLIYISPLHLQIPTGLMISYVDDFSVTVAYELHRTNIRRLRGIFQILSRYGRTLNVEFSIPKTELIHLRTPSQQHSPPSQTPIALGGLVFHPAHVVRWLGFSLTPPLNSQQHFSRRLALASASFSFVKRLSSPGAGIRPFLAHRIAQGLLLPIATYGADFLTPNTRSLTALNSFWHGVCRWVTNNFYSTSYSILLREECLAPMDSYCKYRRDLAAIRIAYAPPTHNPAAARLPPSFPSLSIFRANDSSRPLTRGLSSFYLPRNWRTPVPSPPLRNHLPIDALAHVTIPFMEGLSRFPLVLNAPPPPGTNIPPAALMACIYIALRQRARL